MERLQDDRSYSSTIHIGTYEEFHPIKLCENHRCKETKGKHEAENSHYTYQK
jgi:hypothetical protein